MQSHTSAKEARPSTGCSITTDLQQPSKDAACDNLPNLFVTPYPTLAEKLVERKCELCGATNVDTVMYQVKKLTELEPNTVWNKLMLKKWRKTLVVCKCCNKKIHNHGK